MWNMYPSTKLLLALKWPPDVKKVRTILQNCAAKYPSQIFMHVFVSTCMCVYDIVCVCVEKENGSSFDLITCILNVSSLHSVRRGTGKYSLLLLLSGVCGECSSPTVAATDWWRQPPGNWGRCKWLMAVIKRTWNRGAPQTPFREMEWKIDVQQVFTPFLVLFVKINIWKLWKRNCECGHFVSSRLYQRTVLWSIPAWKHNHECRHFVSSCLY